MRHSQRSPVPALAPPTEYEKREAAKYGSVETYEDEIDMGTYFYSGPVRKVAGDDKGKLDTTRPRPGMVRVEFDGYGPRNIFPFESGQPRLVLAESGHDERVDPDRIALGTRVLSSIEGRDVQGTVVGLRRVHHSRASVQEPPAMLGDTSTETGDEDNDMATRAAPAVMLSKPKSTNKLGPSGKDARSNMYPNFLYIGHFHNDLRHGEGVLYHQFAPHPEDVGELRMRQLNEVHKLPRLPQRREDDQPQDGAGRSPMAASAAMGRGSGRDNSAATASAPALTLKELPRLPHERTREVERHVAAHMGIVCGMGGYVYKGQWENGVRSGMGTLFTANGSMYRGLWRHDRPHGKGTLKLKWPFYNAEGGATPDDRGVGADAGPNKYITKEGIWQDGFLAEEPDGYKSGEAQQGTMLYFDGDVFQGKMLNGRPTGEGTYTYAHGAKYGPSAKQRAFWVWEEDDDVGRGALPLKAVREARYAQFDHLRGVFIPGDVSGCTLAGGHRDAESFDALSWVKELGFEGEKRAALLRCKEPVPTILDWLLEQYDKHERNLTALQRKFAEDNLAGNRGDIALMAAASDEARAKIALAHAQRKRCRDRINALRVSLGIGKLKDEEDSTATMRTSTLAKLERSRRT